jgi:hypothetical protein
VNNFWKALESGWRAGVKQFKRMRTLQRKASSPDPLEQSS